MLPSSIPARVDHNCGDDLVCCSTKQCIAFRELFEAQRQLSSVGNKGFPLSKNDAVNVMLICYCAYFSRIGDRTRGAGEGVRRFA